MPVNALGRVKKDIYPPAATLERRMRQAGRRDVRWKQKGKTYQKILVSDARCDLATEVRQRGTIYGVYM